MPEMDGVELCARVREQPGGLEIYLIILTAKDKNEDKVSTLDTGADEYLVKPCDPDELKARLRAAERIIRLRQEISEKNIQLEGVMRRLNGELQASSQIQRNLLPQILPEVEGYRFAAHYQPSTECSGDFYEVLQRNDGRLGVIIGDISGHGTPVMVAMAMTHMLLHLEKDRASDPAAILYRLNNLLFEHLPTNQYCTVFYAILNPDTGEMTYSSAGHNPPYLLNRADGSGRFIDNCDGFPIKLFAPDLPYENHQLRLEPNQALILYTDGLSEAFNPQDEQFGPERIADCVGRNTEASPQRLINTMLMDMNEFCDGRPMEDDLSLLTLSRD